MINRREETRMKRILKKEENIYLEIIGEKKKGKAYEKDS